MRFSPYVLLRKPIYTLSHLDVFAIASAADATEEEIEAKRKHFLSLIQSEYLTLSLPFSSKVLYQALPHYEFHATVSIRKKEKQTERAITKYLFRMALNPSPLAAFAGSQFVDWEQNVLAPQSKYALSLALAQRKEFFDLCYCDVGLQGIMHYRLNPSLRRTEEGGFSYLHREAGVDSVVQLEKDATFESMYEDLRLEEFTFGQFVEKSDYDVNDFLESQLISPSYPIYTDLQIVNEILASIKERYKIAFNLEELEGQNFDQLDDKQVIAIQNSWIQRLESYANKLGVKLNDKVYSERVFYLNSAISDADVPKINREEMAKEAAQLVHLINSCERPKDALKLNWSSIFLKSLYMESSYQLNELVLEKPSEDVLLLQMNQAADTSLMSTMGIMLRHGDHEKPELINVTTGYAKFFAPALNLATAETQEGIKNWVLDTDKDRAILKDESIHNKNKAHNYLKELDAFGLDFHSPIEERVKVDIKKNKVQIENSDRSIELVNLGIEQVNSRSNAYQNLHFSEKQLPNIPQFVKALQEANTYSIDETVRCQPRVETKQFLLGHKKWIISFKSAFPEFDAVLHSSIIKLNTWRKKYTLPRVVTYSIDGGKSNYHDFHNPWSVDNFVRALKKMEKHCIFSELGLKEEIKGKRLCESYFEVDYQADLK